MNTPPVPSRWTALGLSGGGGTETPAISPHDPDLILINCDMSGAYRTTDGGANWEMLHWRELTGCPFCAPAFHPADPAVVFAAFSYAATLRVSRDRGAHWTPIGTGLPGDLRQIAIDPDQPAHMLAATTTAMFRSTDGGENWTACTGFTGQAIAIHFDRTSPAAARRCFAATSEKVYHSADGGAAWSPCAGVLPAKPIMAFAGGSQAKTNTCILYTWLDAAASAGGGEIFRSTDRGQTWSKLADMPVREGYEGVLHTLLVSDVRPRTVYAVKPCYSAADTVYRSDDAGEQWRPIAFCDKTDPRFNMPSNYVTVYFLPTSIWGWTTCAAAIDPKNPEHLLFNHYCSIFITRDGGKTWTAGETRPAPENPPPTAPIRRHRWITNGLTNTTTWHYYFDPHQPNRHYIAYTDLGMAISTDAGATWTWARDTGANTYEMAFDPDVPGRVWAAFSSVHDIPNNNIIIGDHYRPGPGCVGYSEDFGATWRGQTEGLPGGSATELYDWSFPGKVELPVTSILLDPRSPKDARRLYTTIWERGVFRSDDSGKTWRDVSKGLGTPGVNMRAVRVRLHGDGTLHCLVTGLLRDGALIPEGVGLYRSTDDAQSWHKITAGVDLRWLTDFETDPRDSNVIYLSDCDPPGREGEGGLLKTTDGGKSWRLMARKSSRHFGATLHPKNPDWVYLTLNYNDGAACPLWLSRDAGLTWKPFEDYPFCSAHRVHFDPRDASRIYVTGYGGGAWRGPVEP
ncbi:MAG: hypothetical protein K8S99_03265 [Planctomycetes bacterium]|nr:hypothetical protein [Planctomycetota bacterium]